MGRPAKYPAEFRDSAVEMVWSTEKSIAEIARDLGINEGTLGNWVSRDRIARGEKAPEVLSEPERSELARLRRENVTLRMEREILKKAAAFFVTESQR